MTKLESAIAAAELYRELNAFDCSCLVTNAEGIIIHYVEFDTIKTTTVVGQPASGGAVKQVIATKQFVKAEVPEHVYGVKLRVNLKPIFEDDGTFSGVVGSAINLNTVATMHAAARDIASVTEQMNATTQELAVTASQLAEELSQIKNRSETVLSDIDRTGDILKFVSDVAQSSNLLGLNAAIEAARAGEQGRGFAVVAEEIRKMAANSATSVKDIKTILETIQSQTKEVVETIVTTAQLGERQAAAAEEISATMQQLVTTVNEVERIAASI